MDYHDSLLTKGHNMDSYTFKYVYTCDIEDVGFRVKIGNLDGILPPTAQNNRNFDHGKQNQTSANHSKNITQTQILNNYDFNVVEVLDELSLIDELTNSDEDRIEEDDGDSSTKDDHSSSSKANSDKDITLIPAYSESLQKRQNELKTKQKQCQKLSQIIFGGLMQPVRSLSCHPLITCDLVSNGERLCPPQQTQYKQMSKRYEWNEWLMFSLTMDTLPRDTKVCFTVWDTISPGKMVAVARTSISLFSKHGCLRKGIYDLRLYFNEDCENYSRFNDPINSDKPSTTNSSKLSSNSSLDITTADLDFIHRDHMNKDLIVSENDFVLNAKNNAQQQANVSLDSIPKHMPIQRTKKARKRDDLSSLYFTSTTQYMENDLSLYPDGNCGLSRKVKQLNKLKKKYHNGQIPKVTWLDQLTFLQIERTIVTEKTISTLIFLTVEFPIIVLDGVEHSVVYFEDKEDVCCQYGLIEKEIVAIQDPEISMDNLVEQKHHKLARSARSGISDRDLKPNATIRNQLNAIVNCPSTKQLTSEEQDLVWKFRFYLCSQKKALSKFLKTVNWTLHSEVEQAISVMNEWTPMDVEDALELLSPHFRHPYVRKYAVSRLKQANDEDLQLYLLQLVQALKYEDFNEIRRAFEAEISEHYQPQMQQTNQGSSETGAARDSRKLCQENPHSTAETFLAESIKIFSTNPSSEFINNNNNGESSSSQPPLNYVPNLGSPISNAAANSNRRDEDLATFLISRACANDSLANYFFWYLMVECEGAAKSVSSNSFEHHTASTSHGQPSTSTSAIVSSAMTTSYLVPPPPMFSGQNDDSKWNDSSSATNTNMNNVIDMYLVMMRRFSARLVRGGPEMFVRRKFLLRQQEFVFKLVEIMKEVQRESGNRLKKIEKLQKILASPEPQHRFNFGHNEPLPLPLNPDIKVVSVAAKEATLFKSAMMPAKLAFHTTTGSIYYMIFKHGDDLRQDDLVLQMIILMDKLLRMENLDLKLTPYRVLACSSKHGFLQFIDSISVSEVISSEGTIQNYLRKISANVNNSATMTTTTTGTTSSAMDFQLVSNVQTKQRDGAISTSPSNHPLPSGGSSANLSNSNTIAPEIMDAYVKSCAGYCIITYLLGVGDRHLDNLMMTKTGRLFHIDFGFILGRDPKLRPPPMKITREMVEAMGGMGSDNFAKFVTAVRTAFLHLRRHANLILNLFSLMVDANVPDIALEPDKTVQKVEDKFKLAYDDEAAVHHITEQVEQSVRSIMPVVVDQLHKMTQYLRN